MNHAKLQSYTYLRRFKEKWFDVLMNGFLVALAVAAVLLLWQLSVQRVGTGEYEGRIVDRWGDYAESLEGSRPLLRLVVESSDGKRFTVRVDPSVYDSARVGMRIKSEAGQIVLMDPEPGRTAGK